MLGRSDDDAIDLVVRVAGAVLAGVVAVQGLRALAGGAPPAEVGVSVAVFGLPGLVLAVRPVVGRWVGRALLWLLDFAH